MLNYKNLCFPVIYEHFHFFLLFIRLPLCLFSVRSSKKHFLLFFFHIQLEIIIFLLRMACGQNHNNKYGCFPPHSGERFHSFLLRSHFHQINDNSVWAFSFVRLISVLFCSFQFPIPPFNCEANISIFIYFALLIFPLFLPFFHFCLSSFWWEKYATPLNFVYVEWRVMTFQWWFSYLGVFLSVLCVRSEEQFPFPSVVRYFCYFGNELFVFILW